MAQAGRSTAAATEEGESGPEGGITFKQLKREWKGWEGTDTQVESGFRCYVRPNRSTARTWTAAAAARAVCSAISHGATKAEIDNQVRKRCLPSKEAICDCQDVLLTLRLVLNAAVAIALVIAISRVAGLALPVILSTVVIRFLPRAIRIALGNVRSSALKLPDATRTIEGVFVRVRETVRSIERTL